MCSYPCESLLSAPLSFWFRLWSLIEALYIVVCLDLALSLEAGVSLAERNNVLNSEVGSELDVRVTAAENVCPRPSLPSLPPLSLLLPCTQCP